eukprot:1060734-Prymnesium_polylepis.1
MRAVSLADGGAHDGAGVLAGGSPWGGGLGGGGRPGRGALARLPRCRRWELAARHLRRSRL